MKQKNLGKILFGIAFAGGVYFEGIMYKEAFSEISNTLENLDKNAVPPYTYKIPSKYDASIKYIDIDSDKDLDSVIFWRNSDNSIQRIVIKKDKNKINYPNLDESSLTPKQVFEKKLNVNYIDSNLDGNLESKIRNDN